MILRSFTHCREQRRVASVVFLLKTSNADGCWTGGSFTFPISNESAFPHTLWLSDIAGNASKWLSLTEIDKQAAVIGRLPHFDSPTRHGQKRNKISRTLKRHSPKIPHVASRSVFLKINLDFGENGNILICRGISTSPDSFPPPAEPNRS